MDNPAGIRMGAYELRKLFDLIPKIQEFVLCWYYDGTLKRKTTAFATALGDAMRAPLTRDSEA
jgi:hypothetical protein